MRFNMEPNENPVEFDIKLHSRRKSFTGFAFRKNSQDGGVAEHSTVQPYRRHKSDLNLLNTKPQGYERGSYPTPLESLYNHTFKKRGNKGSKRKEIENSCPVIFEEGESVESLLKKFETLNTLSEQKLSLDQIKRDQAIWEKRKAMNTCHSPTSAKRNKLLRKSSQKRIVKTKSETEHNYSYKPNFFQKKLFFFNSAFE